MATPQSDSGDEARRYPDSRVYRWLDDRLDLEGESFGKAFPEDRYGSFLLGEVALFAFVILAITGTFLGLLYTPTVAEVEYTGQAMKYSGNQVPGAFASVLRITYDVRFGMFTRMVHHWGAYLFVAAMGLHMFRVFFTGAYRNPREPNWLVGSTLLLLGLMEGFFGYALPYDNFSKTATTIGFKMTASIPLLGGRLKNLFFGGDFPADAAQLLPRFFFYHVFLFPALIGGLIGLHMLILLRQKHTEDPGRRAELPESPPRDDDEVIVGVPLVPNQAVRSLVVFLFTASVLSFLAALFPVQRIAFTGPATPFATPAHVGPDWFFMWVFGALKVMPGALEPLLAPVGGTRFVGGVLVPSLIIGAMYAWAFVDRSEEPVNFIANPLDRPLPTAVGVAAITLVIVLSIDGMNTFVAEALGTTTGVIYPYLLGATLVVPPLWGIVTYVMLERRARRLADESDEGPDADPGVRRP